MINISLKNFKDTVPAIVGQVLGSSAAILTALAAISQLYPTIVTEHLIAECGKLLALLTIIAPFIGVKKPETVDPPIKKVADFLNALDEHPADQPIDLMSQATEELKKNSNQN
ncbi:hypothetical protein [uncultured Mucilaginibacter sp.]|uniref:hypothetical protein n=1 Tax=uncultured Mucilaginibacter sp. TaxID=797541 RepID=UPI0025EF652C|nr:hypothetical protein [uncultured Mucilaginibacter sp.]